MSAYTIKQADEIVKKKLGNKEPVKPTFYIKYGPPASGKGGIMKKALQKDFITPENMVTVDVDAIVAESKLFTKMATQEIYQAIREEADVISNQLLNTALLKRFNIAWETTGDTVSWTVQEIKRIKAMGYIITLVYPLVPEDALIQRAHRRQQETGQVPAPDNRIRSTKKRAVKNVLKLIDHVDNIYIYDNSGKKGEESLVIEVHNEWMWTQDDTDGLNRTAKCDCSKLKTQTAERFAIDVLKVLQLICDSCVLLPAN